jgi:hypothetical protein
MNDSIWIDALFNYHSGENSFKVDTPFNTAENSSLPQVQSSKNNIPAEEHSLGNVFNSISFADTIEEKSGDETIQDEKDKEKIDEEGLEKKEKGEEVVLIDSASIDSTARLRHFRYQREDKPYLTLKKIRPSKFFAQPSPNLKTRTIQIDSTGKFVEIRELVGGQQTKIILKLPIEDYVELRLALRERELWEDLGYKYELKEHVKELGDLIKNITDFEIPLPSVGVLSIFGEPKISLKIGGAVDIHGAFRSETTEGVTASRLGNTRNEPDFKQTVQINVNGTIGDKLNITADWNTQRTFEYENQLKIKYTGYEDEIIQSIEAGNVSLQTSPLVGGSEALFGLKALFKMGPFSLTTLASQKKGEVKEVSVSGGSTSAEFTVRAYEYSTSHYFLDTVYASTEPGYNFFYNYYNGNNPQPIVNPEYTIIDIEVWKSINVITPDRSKERYANVYINLDPLAAGQRYPDSLRLDSVEPDPGKIETGRFLLLTRDLDYVLHEQTGYISFSTTIQNEDVIAVAYRVRKTTGDEFYGEFLSTAPSDTSARLVLKLVKPQNLQPSYKQAWKLQLKNIYPLKSRNIKPEGFELYLKYEVEGGDPVTDLATGGVVRLLNVFGLDLLDASKNPNPDNVFDYRPGLTILPSTGEIIFPMLEPFGRDMPSQRSLRYDTNICEKH